ncbi:MAG: hypothetical protein EOM55_03395 [Clostridia bacterium]|nr:hypothetical protein [Clostridia bacterium]
MKYLWKNKIALIIVLLLLLFIQPAISLPEQSKTENIVTAIGVDKTIEDEYEISLQYILPYKSGAENELKLTSVKGENLSEALEKMSIQVGKNPGFAHCKFLVLNDLACEENITSILDYFNKIKTNSNNIIILNTNDSSKDLLSTADSLNSEMYSVVNCSCFHAIQRHYQNFKNIGEYYNSYFGKTKCIVLNVVNTEEEEESSSSSSEGSSTGASSSDSSSSGSSGSSSSSSPKKKFKNDGIIAIFKEGKKIIELTSKQSNNLSLFDDKVKDKYLTIKNFSDDVFDDVQLAFDIYGKKVNISTSFIDGIPHYKLNLTLNLRVNEVISDNMNIDYYVISNNDISDKMKDAIKTEVKQMLLSAEANFKENKYDVVKCFDQFYKFNNKEFKEYLASLSPDKYFIENVVFDYNIKVTQRL